MDATRECVGDGFPELVVEVPEGGFEFQDRNGGILDTLECGGPVVEAVVKNGEPADECFFGAEWNPAWRTVGQEQNGAEARSPGVGGKVGETGEVDVCAAGDELLLQVPPVGQGGGLA